MDERVKFIADVLKGDHTITELCQRYQISRKTGYKWIERFEEAGPKELEDLGRRPKACAHAMPETIVNQILELRYEHPTWGSRNCRLDWSKREVTRSGPAQVPSTQFCAELA